MGLFSKTVLVGLPALAAGYYVKTTIYQGEYLEQNPFDKVKYPFVQSVKNQILGTNDNFHTSKTEKISNPRGTVPLYDFYEQKLDAETTKRILAKYKTNDDILKAFEKGFLLGPTLWVHRFLLGPYFKLRAPTNRVAGFTGLEPELKKLDASKLKDSGFLGFPLLPENKKLKYVWGAEDIESTQGLLPSTTIVYGLFSVVDHGKRTNGGFYDVATGSDLAGGNGAHRLEYEVVENDKHEKNLIVRLVNVTQATVPSDNKVVDETNGLHEFMTRTIVHDVIRELKSNL